MTEAEEFERIMDALDRYEQAPDDEVEPDEYRQLFDRYDQLRRRGHGPQPYDQEQNRPRWEITQ